MANWKATMTLSRRVPQRVIKVGRFVIPQHGLERREKPPARGARRDGARALPMDH